MALSRKYIYWKLKDSGFESQPQETFYNTKVTDQSKYLMVTQQQQASKGGAQHVAEQQSLINGAGSRKVDSGFKMLIEPI